MVTLIFKFAAKILQKNGCGKLGKFPSNHIRFMTLYFLILRFYSFRLSTQSTKGMKEGVPTTLYVTTCTGGKELK